SAAVALHRPLVDELLHLPLRRDERSGAAVVEVADAAVVVTPRNARRADALPPPQIALTSARLHAQRIVVQRNPSGAVAAGAGFRCGGGDGGHFQKYTFPS